MTHYDYHKKQPSISASNLLKESFTSTLQNYFMNRSLQTNPPKKNGEANGILKQSRSKQFQGKMSNFTEVLIQTNDTDVPIIAIYKPDIRKQQRRVQCATIIERNLKKFELFRLHFAFNKINHLKVNEMRITHNVHLFQQLFTKLQNKRTSHAFLHLAASKMKKKCINSAAKILAYFQAKARTNNIKYCMNRLKINNYQSIISTLTNENQLSLQLKQAKDQLFKLKMGLFDQQFVEKSKPFVKFTDHDTFIDSIREMGYSSTVKGETARFELQRSKTNPKKKDSFDNQLIASVLANAIRAYEANIADHIRYEEQLKQQLESYTNTQGIAELNEIIREKDTKLSDMQSFVAEIAKMDTQMRRFAGQKLNSQKILALIVQQEKKLEVRSKKSDGMIPKLYNSRVFLDSVISSAFKKSNQDRETFNKLLDELNQMSHQEQNLRTYLKKIKDNHSIKTMAQTLLSFYEEIKQLTINLQAQVASNQTLTKEMEKLLAENKQNKAAIKQITKEIQQLKKNEQFQESSINSLLLFITTNQKKIQQNQQIDLKTKVQLNERFQSIFKSISSLLNHIYILQNQKLAYIRQIEQLQKKNSQLLNDTKRDQLPSSPKIQGISDISLAERFMTPLKEMLETRQEDKQLKQHILTFEQKIEELIKQNFILQQKLFSMQTNEKVLSEMSIRITQLKTQNDNLRRNNQNYNDILLKYEQSKEKIAYLSEENAKIGFLHNTITEYEYRLRELSIVNSELTEKITSLKQSNSQFSTIASSNLQLSQKINQIYNKSTSKIITQGSEQQLMKQNQLMQEILTLKIQLENTAIRHIQEVNSLRNQINSYQTIISKIEVDIAHRQNQIIQRQNFIQSLNAQFSQMREVSIELREKVEHYEKVITIDTTNKYKDNEQQLNRLRADCQHMFEELQMTIENLRGKDNHIHSLEFTMGSQEDIIASLKRENERLMMSIQQLIQKNQEAEHLISRHKTQITQIKGQYHQLQLQFHQHQISQTQISHSSQVYQREIQEKQMIINNMLEQIKALSASHTAQLNQLKQQFTSKQRVYEEKLSDKDLRISKLQFQLNEKINTVLSLQQLISLYASSSQSAIRHQAEHFAYPYSRDKEIVFLRGQIKSLEQFLNDMANQYQELQKKYQQERERTNRAYLNVSPLSTDKLDFKTTVFSSEHNKQVKYVEEVSERFNHSFLSNISMTFTESDIAKQLNRLMASNESLANSVDYLREENKELFLKIKSISSIEMVIELVFNILLMVGKFKPESSEGAKIWNDLCHLRTVYSGETLFINLEEYCREFIQVS